MKKILIITGFIGIAAGLVSCDKARRNPGRAYMPDMTYSRAYETYSETETRLANSAAQGAHYNGLPVEGTVARGELAQYRLKNDSAGYAQSAAIKNPLDSSSINTKDAERLYLVNCGICHGSKLDGNGPLYNGGNGPYGAAPKNLIDAAGKALSEGTMFHVATYGKGQMGSYASQLSTKQRWMVIAYIKSKQSGGTAAAATDSSATTGTAKIDSTVKGG